MQAIPFDVEIQPVTDPVLTTQNLAVGYDRPRRVVAGEIDLSLMRGEFVCLLGPNGAGKSTLIRTLAGMQPPLAGRIYLMGKALAALSATDRARTLSVVLTDRIGVGIALARDLVALGRYPHTNWIGRLTDEDERAVSWALQAAGASHLAHRNVAELSDGERQKVMIARALAQQPDLLILDEPTAFLDLPRRVEIMALLRNLAHATGKAILLSTHDLDLALRCADRICLLPIDGAMQTGAPEDLILNGAYERAFQSEGIRFDADTGAFVLTAQRGHSAVSVSVSGQGRVAHWTKHALDRAGFRVTDALSACHISIREGDPPSWRVERDGAIREHASICELIASLGCLNRD